MKAITQDRYGEADVLEFNDVERPEIGPDEVLVQVGASSVDNGVWHTVAGLPYLIRLAGYGFRTPKARVPGMDVAGTVESVGANVTGFTPGDRVFGTCAGGAYAEYARVNPDRLAHMPANLAFEQAAAVPIAGITALQAIRDRGRVTAGQQVLVIGAAGGVGSFAVQVTKAHGANVTGLCGPAKMDLVRQLGADDVVDYTREDITDGPRRFDLVIDTAGHRAVSRLRRVLTPRGTLVIIGSEVGGRWTGGVGRQLRATLRSPFLRQSLGTMIARDNQADLRVLAELIESEKVTPVVDRTFPLSEAAEALRHVRANHARGKVVITV